MKNRSQFLKGCARTLVLQLLSEQPRYGYELQTTLRERTNGVFALPQGTLYPLLYALERKGLIEISRDEDPPAAGQRRRYYQITAAGQKELEANIETWEQVVRGMMQLLKTRYAR